MGSEPRKKVVPVRRGMALGMVLLLGLVIMVIGTIMVANSGGLLRNTVDAKSRLRARYAAEGMIEIQMAHLDAIKDEALGGNLNLDSVLLTSLGTGDGEKAQSEPTKLAMTGRQETIQSGLFRGMKGVRIPFLIRSTGVAAGGATKQIEADVYLYQVPIFQFGVFFENDLEIAPGPSMMVFGPVHTNGNAFFRGYSGRTLTFQGPVTVGGTLYHWKQSGGNIVYYPSPDASSGTAAAGLTGSMAPLSDASRPAPVGGVYNVKDEADKLKLPIGGANPHELIKPCDGTETGALRKQKFACLEGVATYIEGISVKPTWLSSEKVFFDRREDRWVKFRDFDVAAALAANPNDSIFYLYDPVQLNDKGAMRALMINAYRIVNGDTLPRNVSIASGNPVYVLGDYNLPNASGSCRPKDYSGSVPDSQKYCNSMIASDAITLLSPRWTDFDYAHRGMKGTLEQPYSNASWTTARWWDSIPQYYSTSTTPKDPAITVYSGTEQTWGNPDTFYLGGYPDTIRLHAAVLTGSKPTAPAWLPPNNSGDFDYNWNNEGGWIGALRFLEDLGGWWEINNWWKHDLLKWPHLSPAMSTWPQWIGHTQTVYKGTTVVFKGSFVCLWNSATPGMDMTSRVVFATGNTRQDLPASITARAVVSKPNGTGYFSPPTRIWGYDERFRSLNNMPPGTPFLSTGIFANWSER